MAITIDPVALDNDYYVSVGPVLATSIPGGVDTLQAGMTDVTAFLSGDNDFDDVPIHATLSIVLTENASTGTYRGKFEGSDISTRCSLLVGTTIYLHVKRQQDFHIVAATTVIDPRPA